MGRTFKNKEEFIAAYQEFYENHPEAPIANGIECLDLIMKKVYAEQILAGTKKLEFREYKDFYIRRIIDGDVQEYIHEHNDDDDVLTFCNDIRQVKTIHFHDYNKSWFLDVECTYNDAFSITKEDICMLNEKYGCHDYDDDLKHMEVMNVPQNERPWIFYFVCGKVLDTNLGVTPKDEEFVDICGGDFFVNPEINNTIKENDNIITIKVSKDVFDSIVSGQQGVFDKEIKPNKLSLYFITDEKGNVKEINGIPQFRKYDAIQFTNKENSYTCLINNADIVYWEADYGYKIPYSELEDKVDYTDCMIEYALGDEVKQE